MEEDEAGRIVARLVPGEMLLPEDADRIEAEVRQRLQEGVNALGPLLIDLAKRCGGTWGPAEQEEYRLAVEAMVAKVVEWGRAEIRRVAVPGVHRP